MKTRNRSRLSVCLALASAAWLVPLPAASATSESPARPRIGVGDDGDPLFLHKVLKEKVKQRREREKKDPGTNAACLKALEADPADEDAVQKHCRKSPGVVLGQPSEEPIRKDGRIVGKKIKAETRFKYDSPGQRYGNEAQERWDHVIVRPPAAGDLKSQRYRKQTNTHDSARERSLLPGAAAVVNDDRDCIDRVTGEQLRDDRCFDGGALRRTLVAVEGGCVHAATGSVLQGVSSDGIEDDCYDAAGNLKTSLYELINEDPASRVAPGSDPPSYDVDGDGRFGEDLPNGINDDGDCTDRVTGRHLDRAGCFDGFGALKQTLEAVSGGCRHVESGKLFEGVPGDEIEDDCYDESNPLDPVLRTTLAELTDEDDGKPVDDDGDGRFDEDGPETQAGFVDQCRQLGRDAGLANPEAMVTADGGCDLTPLIVSKVNAKAGKKVYETGEPPTGVAGEGPAEEESPVEYGEEPRQVSLEEAVTLTCDLGMVLDDESGQCVAESQAAALREARAAFRVAAAGTSVEDTALMGFTFAPPRIRWGLFYKEEACFWIFGCFTLFEAKIGFDFGIGVGFRLPVAVAVADIPSKAVLAGESVTLSTTIDPRDFTAQEYEEFCLGQDPAMGDPAYCQRFAFPNALVPEQGDELVLRMTAFAGIKVVIVEIPIINWGIDLDADLSEWCSLGLAYLNPDDVLKALTENPTLGLNQAIDAAGLNCGSYTTPFGHLDQNGDEPRQFPFIANVFNQMIRADCAEAFAREEVIVVEGETIPLCTGLILGVPGASLGLGLGAELEVSSNLIQADLEVSGDGRLEPAGLGIEYRHSANEPDAAVSLGPIRLENYDPAERADDALLSIGNFTYCLNTFSVRLKGQPMFGGILTILPSFDDFTIFRFTLPGTGCGIPIGQHAKTDDTLVAIPVENHALEVKVATRPGDAGVVDEKTLEIRPGQFGAYAVDVKNLGSVADTFGHFSAMLSNQRDQAAPYSFVINPDNDGDLRTDEDDFGPAGATAAERDEDKDGVADEDPPDQWRRIPGAIDFDAARIFDVQPYTSSSGALTLSISPFAHPSTRPGLYPFQVKADSEAARALGMAERDQSGQYRLGASDVAFIRVTAFRDVRVAVSPPAASLKPGLLQAYLVEGSNMGNIEDSMSTAVAFLDSNRGACPLAEVGKRPECPYRAEPTRIDPALWTSVAGLDSGFGPLAPLGVASDSFTIAAPRDWKGMQDTNYTFDVTVVSPARDLDPPVSNTVTAQHTVIATKESMTRFVQHEVTELIGAIEAANQQGLKTGGTLPIAMHPVRGKTEQALTLILGGNLEKASGPLDSAVKVVEAFLHALDAQAGKIPAELINDWRARAEAIAADLATAQASQVPSAP